MRNRCPDYCCSPCEGGGFMDDLRTKYPDIHKRMQRGLPQARPCVLPYKNKLEPPTNFSYKGGGRRLTKDFRPSTLEYRPSTLEYRPSTLEYRGGGFKDFFNSITGGIRRGINFYNENKDTIRGIYETGRGIYDNIQRARKGGGYDDFYDESSF